MPSTAVEESRSSVQLDTIEDGIDSFRKGECLVVVDDLERENEGDLIVAGAKITTEMMAWIIKHSSGYVCIALPGERLDELEIPLMIETNTEKHKTAYTHTVDYKYDTTTGISAHDRALTAAKLSDPTSKPEDFTRPGHMVPLRAREGGVLTRRGHTEAAIDLCNLAGLPPAGLICELVKPDCPLGSMARRDDCAQFASKWKLKMISIEDLVQYRQKLLNSS
ncbi:hypothetical protein MJO28_004570 [Puccinia striiformis f. sp. tritici]|uniref:3,4-dihydroxy-2-butanone 4-phosphate synthase n=2 Tax=Puccinia striiformis f. sp. tritici TaxID=168172 RepID=A0A0L0VAR4_9BASI|nr:uncharacterized protein Pst134EA_032002 [Puccinia striiformis f. sp. tritici]XP_047808986.1 hypothetical protein Pst134EA_006826 [Puccinia striiformis f. sp. tritici]KAI9608857.1 hypothetical protein H4Q26_005046 [Puccinia striiformis f. sp. tritici PST-130]KNE96385.1 3,4-dihydroxy-2-butanone 4-phosphate synthase [Puccinia striiformis f. sp. tritici PST-78]KAH9441958.1 hypothetical protein Pst134EA_032002 [Puccinia striiformis f. sp. tritici]KAH9459757.1 hypothetical protein Pst134EB_007986